MDRDRAQRAIRQLWDEWVPHDHTPTENDFDIFCLWLEVEHRDMLAWSSPDRRTDMRTWLSESGDA